MNKKDLIDQIASELSVTAVDAGRFVNAFQSILTSEMQQNQKLMLQGFGTFWPAKQKERLGHSPFTNDLVLIKAQNIVKFKPGKLLLEVLNKREE